MTEIILAIAFLAASLAALFSAMTVFVIVNEAAGRPADDPEIECILDSDQEETSDAFRH